MIRNQIHKRALSLFLSFALVFGIFGMDTAGAFAAQNSGTPTVLYLDSGDIVIDSQYVRQNGTDVQYDPQDSGFLIKQHDSGSVQHNITVQGGTQDITIQNVNIDVSTRNSPCAFSITPGAAVNLTLGGTNSLISGGPCAGLQVPGNDDPNNRNGNASLTIMGDGSLTATGGTDGAGIGGGRGGTGGNITIQGGSDTATGCGGGAGIGGGHSGGSTNSGSGGNITVSGGSVTATSCGGGAGIGGGCSDIGDGPSSGSGGNITVSGGSVRATGNGDTGIGGGAGSGTQSGKGGIITISGGSVRAAGGMYGAGIGGGGCCGSYDVGGTSGNITISGGAVWADGGLDGAGIGGGTNSGIINSADSDDSVTISGGVVAATGNNGGAGIGGGDASNGADSNHPNGTPCGPITIQGGIVTATGGEIQAGGGGAGIGGGAAAENDIYASGDWTGGAGGTVTISDTDTEVTAKGACGGNDIGSGSNCNSSGGTLSVSNGATVALANGNTSATGPTFSDCHIINQISQTDTAYGGSDNHNPVSLLTATLTIAPAADDNITLTAEAKKSDGSPVTDGTFTFASYGKASRENKGNAQIKDGKASVTTSTPLTDILTVFTAKYKPVNGSTDDALEAVSYYDPLPLNINNLAGNGFGYNYVPNDVNSGGTVNIMNSGLYTFTGTTRENKIAVIAGVAALITLQDTSIDVSGQSDACAFTLAGNAPVTLTLKGTNKLKSADCYPGLEVPDGASLTIDGGGSDSLTATGIGGGAGIGGGCYSQFARNAGNGAGGTVAIRGQNTQVTAEGKDGGSDIGSGSDSLDGGTLLVAGTDAEPDPDKGVTVDLKSAGIDAKTLSGTAHQFTNCKIFDTGAKDKNGKDISGSYDANGKIRLLTVLTAAPKNPDKVVFGNPVALTAKVTRAGFTDTPALLGSLSFLCDGTPINNNPVSITSGAIPSEWTPSNAAVHQLTARYNPTGGDAYVTDSEDMISLPYSADKATLTVKTAPTASSIISGGRLSDSKLTGGTVTDAGGTRIPGSFSWVNRDKTISASDRYEAVFTPGDTVDYNSIFHILVWVTVIPAPQGNSGGSSHGTSTPTLPTSLTDPSTNTAVDLSGATFPAGVTSVSLAVTPEAANGTSSAPGNAEIPSDPQGTEVYHLVLSQTGLDVIGSPFVYNIRLLDQNGNPIPYFTGTVTVKVAIPAGIHGTPHIFRYEENTGTLTDLGATVQDGFLVFQTTHFSYYVIAGAGDSITLDTKSYQLPVGGSYQIGLRLTGKKAASVKVTSTNDRTATMAKLKNGNILVNGKGIGTAYVMIDVYDNKKHLLTHASVRADVKTGIRPRGDSTRQIGIF